MKNQWEEFVCSKLIEFKKLDDESKFGMFLLQVQENEQLKQIIKNCYPPSQVADAQFYKSENKKLREAGNGLCEALKRLHDWASKEQDDESYMSVMLMADKALATHGKVFEEKNNG